MRDRLRSLLPWIRSQVTNIAVLGALGTIMFLGHHYDWKLPAFSLAANLDVDPRMELTPTPKVPSDGAAKSKAEPKPGDNIVRLASAESLEKTNIQIGEVASMPFPEYVHANGSIDYVKTQMAQLSTRAPGVVWEVLAKVGDQVEKGETLAIVESVDVGKAKSEFLQAVVQFELKQKMLEVSRKLEATIAAKDIVELESRVREARIQMVNAQQTLINMGLPIDLTECNGLSDDDLVRKLHDLGLPPEGKGKSKKQRTSGNLVPLKAPFKGQIIGTDLVEGESVVPGQAKIVIANTTSMWVVLDVGIEDAVRVQPGQTVYFRPDGLRDHEIKSTIYWISTEADPKTRRVQMRAQVENPTKDKRGEKDYVLRANTFGAGKIEVRRPNSLAIAKDAVHWDMESKRHLVFVYVDPQTFEARQVTCGSRNDTMCEIAGDVKAGDRVALQGSYLLKSELLKIRMASSR